jgi:hypothetical protein
METCFDLTDKWKPMTWGEVLEQFASVPLDTPVYEVSIRYHTGDVKMTDKECQSGNLKTWRKKVKAWLEDQKLKAVYK